MKSLLFAALMLAPAPLFAQAAAPAPRAALPAPIDPGRLALAKVTIDRVWPLGTYKRMMDGAMTTMMDSMMSSMYSMKPGDLIPGEDGKAADKALEGKTMRQVMFERDPHFEERMRLTNRTMMGEMGGLMTRMEPQVREGLARAYARKFDAVQLGDMNRFFASPSGAAYARESMTLMVDPEFIKIMSDFAPMMVKEMPRILKAVEAATAHLPPPPKNEADADDDKS